MEKIYFKVLVSDLSDDILHHSTALDPYKVRRTVDGNYIMLSFEPTSVPVELFQKQYIPLTASEARAELANAEWDSEQSASIVYKPRNTFPLCIDSFSFSATANSTSQHDYKLTGNLLFKGLSFLSSDAALGDYLRVEIVDVDNILGGGAGAIIDTPINKAFVQATTNATPIVFENSAPSTFFAKDLYVRIHYTNITLLNNVSAYVVLVFNRRG